MENSIEKVSALRTFNEDIQITVSLDSIAQKLLAQFPEENVLRESLVDQIVGSLRHSPNGITRLYNALNGMPNICTYKVGDKISVAPSSLGGTYGWNKDFKAMTAISATITKIDEFANHGVSVVFEIIKENGDVFTDRSNITVAQIKDYSQAEAAEKLLTVFKETAEH